MGLLKTVFEVNMQLFLKDKQSSLRSPSFFTDRCLRSPSRSNSSSRTGSRA
ncbi:hypothetical protein JMJ78_0008169 [Colletotrichum scovillei]|nr:hypothetical protein JMJ78_0008169 [Colletotrichum scovillei]